MKNTSFERLSKHAHEEHEGVDKVLFWVSMGSGVTVSLLLAVLLYLLTK